MQPVEPILVADLFGEVHDELLHLLHDLTPEDWYKPTVAGGWLVRDIAAHLLDSDIRRLSYQRDQAPVVPSSRPIENYGDLVSFLDQLNADWVRAMRRASPAVLLDFLSSTGPQVATLFRSLDPMGPALFGVAWAGESQSLHWFDVAREYTEKWHHQQQIRDAVGAPPLTQRKWLFPVLDTFLRGLPHRFRELDAPRGTEIHFAMSGDAGGDWTLIREDRWQLWSGVSEQPACRVATDADTAWRLLTKGLRPEQAHGRIVLVGDERLAQPFLGMLAIMG